ncbi:C40 family peptidase [Metabacillus malikii]|uniref:Cell wall-associated NlpC family hydrolase n=1 Tax=Metabacillus malikii TaxID=1504265 RepID=A0ABT9ZA74_9BACI|nr:NlpC/P60 family protein [Metabacillus malikii]MDQ0228844.1 cell wall-associated NlpC family hydrolase [Metabacillus malikii]
MKGVTLRKEAIVISSVAAGVLFGGPTLVLAHESPATSNKLNSYDYSQVVRYGHTGSYVSNIQKKLTSLTLYNGAIDGIFGKATEHSVKQFQQLHHLKVDGIVGKRTLTTLSAIQNEQKTYQLGDKNEEVKSFQTKLKALHYYTGHIDGIFGPLTLKAVQEYQEKNKLELSGTLNTATQIHLLSNRNKKGKTLTKIKVQNVQEINNNNIVVNAKNLLGSRYVWGGNTPSGFDCSGFIKYIFEKENILLPRTVNELWNYAKEVQKVGVGDLVFFETYKPGPSHVGVYIGNNQFIHASSSKGVTISNLSGPYWKERYLGAKKV